MHDSSSSSFSFLECTTYLSLLLSSADGGEKQRARRLGAPANDSGRTLGAEYHSCRCRLPEINRHNPTTNRSYLRIYRTTHLHTYSYIPCYYNYCDCSTTTTFTVLFYEYWECPLRHMSRESLYSFSLFYFLLLRQLDLGTYTHKYVYSPLSPFSISRKKERISQILLRLLQA